MLNKAAINVAKPCGSPFQEPHRHLIIGYLHRLKKALYQHAKLCGHMCWYCSAQVTDQTPRLPLARNATIQGEEWGTLDQHHAKVEQIIKDCVEANNRPIQYTWVPNETQAGPS
jgi:hypothetical protein